MKLSDMLEVPAEQFGQEGFWLFRNNFDFMLKHALIVNIIHGEEKGYGGFRYCKDFKRAS